MVRKENDDMCNKIQKSKCVKMTLKGFSGLLKAYDDLQLATAKMLSDKSDGKNSWSVGWHYSNDQG